MKYTYKCFEDNAGCLHLAVLDDFGACVYYLADQDRALIVKRWTHYAPGVTRLLTDGRAENRTRLPAMCGSSMLSTAATVVRKRSNFNRKRTAARSHPSR